MSNILHRNSVNSLRHCCVRSVYARIGRLGRASGRGRACTSRERDVWKTEPINEIYVKPRMLCREFAGSFYERVSRSGLIIAR